MQLETRVAQKIFKLMLQIPEEKLCLSITTLEQYRTYVGYRVLCATVGGVVMFRHLFKSDLLERFEESGQLSHLNADRYRKMADFVERLWLLVQISERFVRKEFVEHLKVEYPFESPFHLFSMTLQEEIDADFSMCLKPYHEFSSDKYEKMNRDLAKKLEGQELKPPVESKLLAVVRQHEKCVLMSIVLAVAHQKSARNNSVKSALEDFYIACNRLYEAEAKGWRRRGSFRWYKGQKQKGAKHGGTYSAPNA